MAANYEYSHRSQANLPLLVQMQLSEKLATFSKFFIPFSKSTLNFEHFFKKNEPHGSNISKVIDSERRV